jgi:hypothetical protein
VDDVWFRSSAARRALSCPFRSFALAATGERPERHEFETGVRAAENAAGGNVEAAR